ncbi:hypothetical protein HanXRQr2_Chr09g0395551 [Helianthus annuus]|uniref:Uncharacterized protein n=1 Tax=Helianthus annuus TaxID=4232 RepID=A0A9K3I7F4_HELAN|nr:hypothetical protein HanXRQr2_Chr09g0395551 [Helianthus annuus]KAJ0893749.1 hypothetical protein HanPSC8_Chr09g0381321 [Helianthus annuus]
MVHRSAKYVVQPVLVPEVWIFVIDLQVEQPVHRAVHILRSMNPEILHTMKSGFHQEVRSNLSGSRVVLPV